MRPPFIIMVIYLGDSAVRILAGILALVGGIMSLRRVNLILATIGAAFILSLSLEALPSFFAQILYTQETVPYLFDASFLIHLVTTVFSLLGLTFIGISKSEFS